jgi:hypothetical protein
MMKRSVALVLLLAALTGRPPAVCAGGPAVPEYSSVDSALTVCPAGDLPFVAIARIDPGVLAFRTWTILVDVTDCEGFVLGTIPQSSGLALVQYGGHTYLEQYCVPFGHAEFRIPGGGVAAGRTIPVIESAHGVVLRTRTTVLSPDQNGDLVVDDADVALATAKMGGSDPTADFDFDGVVTSADLAVLHAHVGHADITVRPTPIARTTWGGIKQLYRADR